MCFLVAWLIIRLVVYIERTSFLYQYLNKCFWHEIICLTDYGHQMRFFFESQIFWPIGQMGRINFGLSWVLTDVITANLFCHCESLVESVQDFLIKFDMKPCMHLVEISIFSLNHVKLTKIMINLLEHLKIRTFKVIFLR